MCQNVSSQFHTYFRPSLFRIFWVIFWQSTQCRTPRVEHIPLCCGPYSALQRAPGLGPANVKGTSTNGWIVFRQDQPVGKREPTAVTFVTAFTLIGHILFLTNPRLVSNTVRKSQEMYNFFRKYKFVVWHLWSVTNSKRFDNKSAQIGFHTFSKAQALKIVCKIK